MGYNISESNKLYEAILSLKNEEECQKFFEDICTIQEIKDMSQRIAVAGRLYNGQIYSDIAKDTGASTATISRVNKCLTYGSGGYRLVLDRISGKSK